MRDIIEFAGSVPSDFGLLVVNYPSVPAAERDIEELAIPGRDGTLIIDNRRYSNIEVPIDFNYIGDKRKWWQRWREVQKWLLAKNELLYFDDDDKTFLAVKYVKLSSNERKTKRIGYFTATFICEPYYYLISGMKEIKQNLSAMHLCATDGKYILTADNKKILTQYQRGKIINLHETCMPIYRICGTGKYHIVINKKAMSFIVDKELIIDTKRQVAYSGEMRMNTSISGSYEDLWLVEGENVIETNGEFDLYITPNWREL